MITDGDEGGDVLGETGAAVSETSVEEGTTDAGIHSDPFGDEFDIGVTRLTDMRDRIDVGDLEGEEGIRGVLDQFGAVDVGDKEGGDKGFIDLLHQGGRPVAVRAKDDAVRFHQIGHSRTFAKEFGIRNHVEFGIRRVALDRLGDLFTGLDRDGGFVDDDLVALDARSDFAGDFFDELQIHRAIGIGRCWHRDKDHIAVIDSLLRVGGEGKAPGRDILGDEVGEAGLVDGDFAPQQRLDFLRVVVDAHHFVPHFREAGTRRQADISGTDNRQFHLEKGQLATVGTVASGISETGGG